MAIRRNPPACNPCEGVLQHRKKERNTQLFTYIGYFNQQRCEKGSILPNQNIFHSLKFENSMLFSPRDHSEIAPDALACERNA